MAARVWQRAAAAVATAAPKRIAVILSGSGVFDGSEVHEASAALVQLSRLQARYQVYAPNKTQMHVVNHLTGETQNEQRNVLVESARIARGKAMDLRELKPESYDGVILPGGFGAAKNLSNFATMSADCTVDPEVERVLHAFHAQRKPIGLCCIAPVLAAKIFPGCTVTVGSDTESAQWPYAGAAAAVKAMKGKHVVTDIHGVCVDEGFNIVTAPAFMCETDIHLVHDSVARMVTTVVQRTRT